MYLYIFSFFQCAHGKSSPSPNNSMMTRYCRLCLGFMALAGPLSLEGMEHSGLFVIFLTEA